MLFRYFRIPLTAEHLKVMHYAPFIMHGFLILFHMPTEWSLFDQLQGANIFYFHIDHITRPCLWFIWNNKKKSLVWWAEMWLPKTEHGLIFRDLVSWNSALLAKFFSKVNLKRILFGLNRFIIFIFEVTSWCGSEIVFRTGWLSASKMHYCYSRHSLSAWRFVRDCP